MSVSRERTCGDCGTVYPETEEYFFRRSGRWPTFYTVCKKCRAERYKEWRARPGNRDRVVERQREIVQQRKARVLSHYSGGDPVCACCGERHLVFLTLDHVNGDGAAHRKAKRASGDNRVLYQWVQENGYPPDFQVLCFNCNWAKSKGGCPHQGVGAGK